MLLKELIEVLNGIYSGICTLPVAEPEVTVGGKEKIEVRVRNSHDDGKFVIDIGEDYL